MSRRSKILPAAAIPGFFVAGALAASAVGAGTAPAPSRAVNVPQAVSASGAGTQGGQAAALDPTATDAVSQLLSVTAQTEPSAAADHIGGGPLGDILDGLVADKTITSAQRDKIVAALEAARPQRPDADASPAPGSSAAPETHPVLGDLLDPLVKDGTITQAQEDAIVKAVEARRVAPLKSALDALVTDGTITAAEQTAIVDAFAKATPPAPEKGERPDRAAWAKSVLDGLVTGGTLTAAQETKVQAALQAAGPLGGPGRGFGGRGHGGPGGPGFGPRALGALVADKTLTQDQADKIKAAFVAQETNESDADEQLEHTDRAAWTKQVLDPLVKDATITADQETKVLAAFAGDGPREGRGIRGFADRFIDSLVADGTITQAQADKIATGVQKALQELRASGPAAGETPNSFIKTALAALVKDGTITQAQADKVQAAVDARLPGHVGGRGRGWGRGRGPGDDGGANGGPGAPAAPGAPASPAPAGGDDTNG